MKQPVFFIVGAAKAGTTSLFEYLKQHSEIYFSPIKEPNYFSTDIHVERFSDTYRKNTFLDVDGYFENKPLKPLQLTYVRKEEHYRQLFEGMTTETIAGEASTSYLVSEVAARNIYNFNPLAKILAVLRHPVERAFSHYLMALRYGHTKLTFREALEEDIHTPEKGIGISEMFLEFGMYATQLKRYYARFPASQVKVILFSDLVNDAQKTLTDVQLFLGVTHQEIDAGSAYNEARIPKYPAVNKLLVDLGIKNMIKGVAGKKAMQLIKEKMFSSGKNNVMKPADRKFVLDLYRGEIKKLADLIDRDLSAWQK